MYEWSSFVLWRFPPESCHVQTRSCQSIYKSKQTNITWLNFNTDWHQSCQRNSEETHTSHGEEIAVFNVKEFQKYKIGLSTLFSVVWQSTPLMLNRLLRLHCHKYTKQAWQSTLPHYRKQGWQSTLLIPNNLQRSLCHTYTKQTWQSTLSHYRK